MEQFFRYIFDMPVLAQIYDIVRAIGILLDVIFVGVFLYSLRELIKGRPKFVYYPRKWQKHIKKKKKPQLSTPVIASAWTKVQAKRKEDTLDSLRLAVVEADGIVDEVLKRMGLSGETFADRLGHLNPDSYHSIERLWGAHRLRNNLVHTPGFQMASHEAEEALAAQEAFLKEVKAL